MDNNKKVKKAIFHVLVIILFLPLIQKSFILIQLTPLHGYFVQPVQPIFNRNSWLAGSFQDSMNIYIENTLGFRPFFIRLNNQINYSLFNTAGAANTIIGKDNILFQENYITGFRGDDYVGDSIINEKVRKLAFIQQKLKEKGKYLIYLIAPGKASFYEEKIPPRYFKKPKSLNNYTVSIKAFKKNNINLIDMRAWFLQEKQHAKYPLFSRCGTH